MILINVKNVCLASLLMLVVGDDALSAEPKTWTKDASGRVLIYRVEPSKGEAIFGGLLFLVGLPFFHLYSLFDSSDLHKFPCLLYGLSCTVFGTYLFKRWYDSCSLLFKPLIIIDRRGITYEGRSKIFWKDVREWYLIERIAYQNGYKVPRLSPDWIGLGIITSVDKLEIFAGHTAITLKKLYQLIDEAYKAYQELEKERVA